MEGFNEAIEKNWREPINGRPVYVIWKKLQRLQPSVRKLSKPLASINIQLERARTELRRAQQDLMQDIMNPQNIEKVKECTKDVIKGDGIIAKSQTDIEQEVLEHYDRLMGKADNKLKGIDITIMRDVSQLNNDQRDNLIQPVTKKEVYDALKDIGDLKGLGMDGYGAKFFKATWSIIKHGLIYVVQEFFMKQRIKR
ncbi:hypothetical protein KIW84_052605 [Lathyrus oleraceus]|uniref:Uncharacterized protein n=1 Tax=Pisum sativum TaxID=3888 RepID=A0A9D4WQJ6_PEA|nr:hypothetical protein KIW84_052605 [Pisum sativum]